ncbi:MAG: M20/M25/M40 family metallo-hydrolase, partial [Chloroflexi bacterium]|nr:M20/M25/M40 family metallo-hydrolase [Chloroflexota bacterium]
MQQVDWRGAAAELAEGVIGFTQRLVQTPSISGEEGALAALVTAELRALGYDDVIVDEIGNVVGVIRGVVAGPGVLYNTHLDHVDPGRRDAWAHDPYAGTIADGYIHGRGASDIKGPLAAQVYAGALLRRSGLRLRGNVVVSCVVQEETADHFGIRFLCDHTLPAHRLEVGLAVLGEPTGLDVYLGHRGRTEIEVETQGRTCHASAPWRGVNAVYQMVPVVERIRAIESALPVHPTLGQATIALTVISCSPGRLSVVPDHCLINLDRRFLPDETLESMLEQIQAILDVREQNDPDFRAIVRIREVEQVSYTGYRARVKKLVGSYLLPTNHPKVSVALDALRGMGASPKVGHWTFGTDGSYTAGLGIPTIGYSAGVEANV